jgi:hypothetical protein
MVNRIRSASSKRKVRTGVTISATELHAADIRLRGSADRGWRVPLDPPPSENGHWPSLTAALAELARTLGVSEGTLSIALVPPFTEVRRLEFPPVREEDLQRLLARGAARYFVGARTPQVVGASLAGRRTRGAPTPVIAAAAPARLIAAIRHAAQQTGWSIETIAPAEGAWASAALEVWPSFARQRSFALVAHEDRTDLLEVDDGLLIGVRRFRAGADDAAMVADAVGAGARVGVLGAVSSRRRLIDALASLGVAVQAPAGEWAGVADDPNALAAHFAGRELGPVLRGEDSLMADRAAARRMVWRVAAAAAALFVVAAALELWGVNHQLAAVRAERERIRPEIASTMVGRTTVDAASRHLSALTQVERTAPHWSSVIASVSDALPDDAFLMALRTRDDSLIVDGLADHAARVFDALMKSRALADVKAAAPVRRELQENGTVALEHFTIGARVVPPSAAPGVTPASDAADRSARR